jgi:hypothetical protein
MNTVTLRETTPSNGKLSAGPKQFDPTRIFVQRDRLTWFWFGVAILAIAGAAVERIYLVQSFKERERVVIIDPSGTYYLAPLLSFPEARQLHLQQSSLAAIAFLQRNPKGFDHADLLKQMFLKRAWQKANTECYSEQPEFKAKQLHQKAEVDHIDVLQTRDDFVLTQARGQLIRNGIFDGKSFTEVVPFKLSLKLQRNPNMALNGRFPTAVLDFKYEMQH